MKLSLHTSPYIRYRESCRTVMSDMVIAVAPLYFMACFYYGIRALVVGLTAVLTCLAADWLASLVSGNHQINLRDWSAIVTGMLLALMMPASVDLRVVIFSSLFAIWVVKAPFGGTGNNLFNPAAAGAAFALVCWPSQMLNYPAPLSPLPLAVDQSVRLMQGPAATLSLGGVPNVGLTELLLGSFPGPMGASNVLIVLACLAYLVVRRCVKWYVPAAFLATASIVPLFLHNTALSAGEAVLYELGAHSLLFVAVYLLSEPATCPKRNLARLMYAAVAGVCTSLFRYFGAVEQSAVFALILMNAVAPLFDYLVEQLLFLKRGESHAA